MNKTVPIKEVVEQYLLEKGQDTKHSFPRVLNAMVRALKELEWDVTGSLVYKMLDLTSNGQLELPTDCIRVVDLGVINTSGEFVSIEYNANYAPRRTYDNCGNEVNLDSGNRLDWADGSNGNENGGLGGLDTNRHGESTGRQYGLGGHSTVAQYGFDAENGVINISSDASFSRYMLIYLSNFKAVTGNIMVHEFMVEPLLAGTEWILARRLRSIGRGEKQILERNFITAKNNLSIRMSSLSVNQLKFLGRAATKPAKF